MSGRGNSTFVNLQPSNHDQNPYDVAADMIKAGLLNDQVLPNGTNKKFILVAMLETLVKEQKQLLLVLMLVAVHKVLTLLLLVIKREKLIKLLVL
jgi:hypothetical protein